MGLKHTAALHQEGNDIPGNEDLGHPGDSYETELLRVEVHHQPAQDHVD